MARVKRGVTGRARHKEVVKAAKGYVGRSGTSLRPALQRLEKEGLIDADWRTSENNRRARYYTLTPAGRKQLTAEEKDWLRVSAAVTRVLRTT